MTRQRPGTWTVIRMSNVSEAMSWLAWLIVTDESHGYSQPNRYGDGTKVTYQIPKWGPATTHGGDYDCSSLMKAILEALGIPTGGFTYTGNELNGLLSTGLFTAYRSGTVTPKDGDILLRSGHTEMVVNGGTEQAGFRRSEHHSITGRKGDQDGQEATHSRLDMSRWTWVIRYTGPDRQGPGDGASSNSNGTRPDANRTCPQAKPATSAGKVEDEIMKSAAALITPTHDGKPLGFVAFWDGHELRGLDNADQVPAIQMVYKEMGQDVPSFMLADNWFYRFCTAVSCTDSALMAKMREFFPNEVR